MKKEDCKIGMKVSFGRPNSQKHLGKVVKLNPEKATVNILESPIGNQSPLSKQHILVPYLWMEEQ